MNRPVKTDNIACRIIEGQAFIINTKTSTLHELDETATFIWRLVEKGRGHEDIARSLSEEFDVSREQASKDTADFLRELEKKGILAASDETLR